MKSLEEIRKEQKDRLEETGQTNLENRQRGKCLHFLNSCSTLALLLSVAK